MPDGAGFNDRCVQTIAIDAGRTYDPVADLKSLTHSEPNGHVFARQRYRLD
jgi:hypothetical protein